MKCISPSSAISIDVFPEPVGPTMRFIPPVLNTRSSSIRRRNSWREGVRVPSRGEADQANWAPPKPISLVCDAELMSTWVSSGRSVYLSRSSVVVRKSLIRSKETLANQEVNGMHDKSKSIFHTLNYLRNIAHTTEKLSTDEFKNCHGGEYD